ncbi:flagellar hook-associated protein FlgL [Crenobacter cavernae]|uniref:Flagellar hook-associated protein 3 n=1 Tax=Crenobacter cavernae TaxID=2290923 RepID=A0A345Y7G8_9NEIS|nr:flagellar hook-associated protein FlgL [Crenobacter cavernae]AXK39870.1 flagellar hook-associated protein 3 [Crenobacter cavernae]
MRVSSNTQYLTGTYGLQKQQSQLGRLQEQLSLLKRVVRPSDDPVASSQVVNIMQAQSRNTQFLENAKNVESRLAVPEATLRKGSEVIQNIKTLAVQAGNGGLTPEDRRTLQTSLREQVKELVGLANTTDANGDYLFAGTRTQTKPFDLTVNSGIAIQYNGDYGQLDVQVSTGRDLSITDPGGVIFGVTSAIPTPVPPPVPPAVADPNATTPGSELWQAVRRLDEILSAQQVAVPSDPATAVYPSYDDSLAMVLDGLDTGLDQLLRVDAKIGARMKEAESLQTVGEDINVQYAANISNLQDLDVPQAISDFQLTQTALQASQKTYQQISQLSLFNYL